MKKPQEMNSSTVHNVINYCQEVYLLFRHGSTECCRSPYSDASAPARSTAGVADDAPTALMTLVTMSSLSYLAPQWAMSALGKCIRRPILHYYNQPCSLDHPQTWPHCTLYRLCMQPDWQRAVHRHSLASSLEIQLNRSASTLRELRQRHCQKSLARLIAAHHNVKHFACTRPWHTQAVSAYWAHTMIRMHAM
jgi:hypothetical protein